MFIKRRNICILVTLFGFFVNVLLFGLHTGFELGHQHSTTFFISGGSGYELLGRYYSYLSLAFFILLMIEIVEKYYSLKIISFFILASSVLLYRVIYLQKNLVINVDPSFTNLMRQTIPFDLIVFICLLGLLMERVYAFLKRTQIET